MISLLLATATQLTTPQVTRQQQIDQFCAYVVGIPYASDNFTKEEFERFQVCVNSLD